jgi:hypothetical protein
MNRRGRGRLSPGYPAEYQRHVQAEQEADTGRVARSTDGAGAATRAMRNRPKTRD